MSAAAACKAAVPKLAERSPLAQLLHALNQPLTGLQCSMEVALAASRTAEQYVRGLQDNLELTARMRSLVEAIRAVTDLAEENNPAEAVDLNAVLRATLEDLAPVAELKSVRITFDCPSGHVHAMAGSRILRDAVFRLIDSGLSFAAENSGLLTAWGAASGSAQPKGWMQVQWESAPQLDGFIPAELGLLVAQAGFEKLGWHWARERSENREVVIIRIPGILETPRQA